MTFLAGVVSATSATSATAFPVRVTQRLWLRLLRAAFCFLAARKGGFACICRCRHLEFIQKPFKPSTGRFITSDAHEQTEALEESFVYFPSVDPRLLSETN